MINLSGGSVSVLGNSYFIVVSQIKKARKTPAATVLNNSPQICCAAQGLLVRIKCSFIVIDVIHSNFNTCYGISTNSCSHAEWRWSLKGLAEGVVKKEWEPVAVFTARVENNDFLRRRWLGPYRTLKGWPLKPGRTGEKCWGPDPVLRKTFWIRLWGLHGGDACKRSADPVDVVTPYMAVDGNPSPTAGFALDNRRGQQVLASWRA